MSTGILETMGSGLTETSADHISCDLVFLGDRASDLDHPIIER